MYAVDYTRPAVSFRRMVTPSKSPRLTDAQKAGQALKRLRTRYGMSQRAAADAAGTSQQNWQRYEQGAVDAFLKATVQRRMVEALGASMEELGYVMAEIEDGRPPAAPMGGMAESRPLRRFEFPMEGRVRAGKLGMEVFDPGETEVLDLNALLGPDVRFLPVAGESMLPYAEPGGHLSYNLKRGPARGKGCVVALEDGTFLVKRYEGVEGSTLVVTELFPVERKLEIPLQDVRGVYRVGLRVD